MKLFIGTTLISLFSISVYSQELSAFSGFWGPEYYQDDKEISRKEIKSLLMEYDASEIYWKKKMKNEAFFYGTYAVAIGSAVWWGAELGQDSDNTTTPALVTLGSLIVSAIFVEGTTRNGKKAILTYNKQFDNKTTYRLVPIGDQNGLGLAIKF